MTPSKNPNLNKNINQQHSLASYLSPIPEDSEAQSSINQAWVVIY